MILKKISNIILSTKDIIFDTNNKWKKIASNNTLSKDVYLKLAIPLYIFAALLSLSGALLNSYTLQFSIFKTISVFLSLSIGVYTSASLIQYLAPKKLNTKHRTTYFKLVIYSVSILAILKGIGNLFPPFSFMKQIFTVGELYFIRIFWLGLKPMINLEDSKKISFTIISALIIMVSILMLEKIFNMMFNIPIISI